MVAATHSYHGQSDFCPSPVPGVRQKLHFRHLEVGVSAWENQNHHGLVTPSTLITERKTVMCS